MNLKKIHGICTILEIVLFFIIIWFKETRIRIAILILFVCVVTVRQIVRRKLGITIFNDDKD
jgi:hypothetical protein